jgi:hypothetical protein
MEEDKVENKIQHYLKVIIVFAFAIGCVIALIKDSFIWTIICLLGVIFFSADESDFGDGDSCDPSAGGYE